MKKIFLVISVMVGLQVIVAEALLAQSNAGKAADCSTYARNRAESERGSSSAMGSGLRGAAGGALFGAIIDGGKGAGKGAALGGGLGVIGGAARGSRDREARYQYYYNACMRGEM